MTGRKPESGKSLGDLYPKLLSEWDYEANGEITPFDAFPHSGKKYWWICPICGGHYSQRVVKKTSKSPQKCPYCRNLKVLIGYNDLQSQCPELAKEWSPKNEKKANEVNCRSKKPAFWVCGKCGFEYTASIASRSVSGTGCAACTNKAVWPGHNDLATKFPQILEIWDFDKNELKPWEVVPGSAKYAYFVCPKGHHHRSQICEVTKSIAERGRTSCSKCSSKSSASEYTVLFYIQKIFGDEVIHTEKIGPEKIEADIYIPSIKTAIEYDGIFYHSSEKAKRKEDKKEHSFSKLGIRLLRIKESDRNEKTISTIRFIRDSYTGPNFTWAINALISEIAPRPLGTNFVDLNRDQNTILKYKKDIETKQNLLQTNPEIAEKWDYQANYPLRPEYFTRGSNYKVKWKCKNHPWHPYSATIKSQACNGHGCPYCSGSKVLIGFNDLATTHPELAKELIPEKNDGITAQDISAGSNIPIVWTCKTCGSEWTVTPNSRTNSKRKNGKPSGCKKCSGLARIAVQCVETKEVFTSCKEAGRSVDLTTGGQIKLACENASKMVRGYHWAYVENQAN